MSCGKPHFEPINFDKTQPPDWLANDPEYQALTAQLAPDSALPKRKWGGRRAGAGAPKGNINALKHGRTSRAQKQLLAMLIQIPQAAETLVRIADRRRKQQRKVEAGAAALLAELLQRTGQIILEPDDNQLESNQDLLTFLRAAEQSLKEIIEKQSREALSRRKSIKRPPASSSCRSSDLPERSDA